MTSIVGFTAVLFISRTGPIANVSYAASTSYPSIVVGLFAFPRLRLATEFCEVVNIFSYRSQGCGGGRDPNHCMKTVAPGAT